MRLTIIIPVYNEAAFLRRCLDSITLRDDVQIVIVDDASTDGSFDLEFEYQSRTKGNVRLAAMAKRSGVSHARNEGIKYSAGEYVTFLDADDALRPDGVDNMLKAIGRNPDDDVIQLNHYRCTADGCKPLPRFWARAGFYDLAHLPPKWVTVWNKIYRKAFLDEHGIRFPEGQQFDEDRRFNIECLRYNRGIKCSELTALCKYFDNDASLCHTMDADKIASAIYGLTDMLRTETSPEIAEVIRQSIIRHLNSKKYYEIFGGRLKKGGDA